VELTRVASDLRRIWLNDLRYSYAEAHYLEITDTGLQLDAVTRIAADGFYVTARVAIRRDSRPIA
jgi:hypothetical protein